MFHTVFQSKEAVDQHTTAGPGDRAGRMIADTGWRNWRRTDRQSANSVA